MSALRVACAKSKFNSPHEAYAVLLEEVDEFWDEVKKKPAKRNKQNMLKELSQIAAVALKAISSLDLIEKDTQLSKDF